MVNLDEDGPQISPSPLALANTALSARPPLVSFDDASLVAFSVAGSGTAAMALLIRSRRRSSVAARARVRGHVVIRRIESVARPLAEGAASSREARCFAISVVPMSRSHPTRRRGIWAWWVGWLRGWRRRDGWLRRRGIRWLRCRRRSR